MLVTDPAAIVLALGVAMMAVAIAQFSRTE
jgi:hypothetical protein